MFLFVNPAWPLSNRSAFRFERCLRIYQERRWRLRKRKKKSRYPSGPFTRGAVIVGGVALCWRVVRENGRSRVVLEKVQSSSVDRASSWCLAVLCDLSFSSGSVTTVVDEAFHVKSHSKLTPDAATTDKFTDGTWRRQAMHASNTAHTYCSHSMPTSEKSL